MISFLWQPRQKCGIKHLTLRQNETIFDIGNGEREGGNKEKMRKCREWISLLFLIIFPFTPHFFILSPFSRSLAARLPKVMQPCSAHNKRTAVESGCVLRSAEFNWVPLFILASLSFHCTVPRTPGQRTVPYGNIYEKHLQRIHLEDSSQEAYSYRAYFDKQ